MNYKLTEFQIKEAAGSRVQGQNASEYMSCVAFNPMNRFEKTHNIVLFDRGMVAYYKQKLPISRGGLLPDESWSEEGMDPRDRIFVNGIMVEYPLNGLYCRRYTNDIVDANGNVINGKAKGDIICGANGLPIIFDKISVFCQYEFKTESVLDEYGYPKIDPATGNPMMRVLRDANGMPIESWVAGWSPSEVGESMRRLLTPYTQDMQTATMQATGINTNPLENIQASAEELFEEEPTSQPQPQQVSIQQTAG